MRLSEYSGHGKVSIKLWVLLWLFVLPLLHGGAALAGGGDDHSHPGDEASPVITASAGGSETEIELRLTDLAAGAPGTEVALAGARIRGFLKHSVTGQILQRVTARPEATAGVYSVYFNGDRVHYQFPGPGTYLLELNIQPLKGEAIDTTIEFALQPPAAASPSPWRRLLPILLGVLALMILVILVWKLSRRKPPVAPSSAITSLLICSVLLTAIAWRAGLAWAHEGEDHSQDAAPAAPAALVAAGTISSIRLGEATTTTRAGNIGITVITRTRAATAPTLAPGEVTLPAQTAELLQIKTQSVTVAKLATGINFSGQIAPDPNGIVRVASIVPGRITRLAVSQGDTVQQGQVVATIESRAVGEAQSAYQQAQARLENARTNLDVVQRQARAGVFSRAPVEAAQRAQAEAAGDVRVQEAAVAQARTALENTRRSARVGAYANPALEAARSQAAQAREAASTTQAALDNAIASVEAAQTELRRRQELASAGAYQNRPVEEARRALVAAQAARGEAQSEVATTRANLTRARTLAAEGLISRRDLETAQQAFDTATARLETAQADERAAQQELERQQRVASSNVNNIAEVQAAQSTLAQAQADVRSRRAEVERARTGLRLAQSALTREQAIFGQNLANRREVSAAASALQSAQAQLYKARRALEVTGATLSREQRIFRENLNNTSQVQAARAGYVQAQADARAARSTLDLLRSSPGGSVAVPVRAPLSGVVQTRDVAVGELVQADAPLMTIVNLRTVAVEAALFEQDVASVRIGSPVRVTTEAVPGRTFNGRISFISTQLDPASRTLTARALLDNPGVLRPGMFVRGQIQTGDGTLSITVPASAVLDDGAARVVFVAKQGKYQRREVALGNQSNGRVEIKSGLKQGEVVVTEGAAALRAQSAKQ